MYFLTMPIKLSNTLTIRKINIKIKSIQICSGDKNFICFLVLLIVYSESYESSLYLKVFYDFIMF